MTFNTLVRVPLARRAAVESGRPTQVDAGPAYRSTWTTDIALVGSLS
jgi:hypothetical protein